MAGSPLLHRNSRCCGPTIYFLPSLPTGGSSLALAGQQPISSDYFNCSLSFGLFGEESSLLFK